MSALDRLEARVVRCRLCPRLVAWREEVARTKRRSFAGETYWGKPLPALGDEHARLVLVGLAPAAHGGNRTGRMFTGDRSGDWLYEALFAHGFATRPTSLRRGDGLELVDTFITAAARCAPPDNRPTPEEFARCRPYMVAEFGLLRDARVIVALGALAWEHTLRAYEERGGVAGKPRPRHGHGAEVVLPGIVRDDFAGGREVTLLGSYHPSQQNTQTGRLTRPMFHSIFSRALVLLESR
ncbi:MAG: uracil-DNA glycosylase [Candidatus Eisenbacteria bacterium]